MPAEEPRDEAEESEGVGLCRRVSRVLGAGWPTSGSSYPSDTCLFSNPDPQASPDRCHTFFRLRCISYRRSRRRRWPGEPPAEVSVASSSFCSEEEEAPLLPFKDATARLEAAAHPQWRRTSRCAARQARPVHSQD